MTFLQIREQGLERVKKEKAAAREELREKQAPVVAKYKDKFLELVKEDLEVQLSRFPTSTGHSIFVPFSLVGEGFDRAQLVLCRRPFEKAIKQMVNDGGLVCKVDIDVFEAAGSEVQALVAIRI